MDKYTIVYVDEEQEERDAFEIYFGEYSDLFAVQCALSGEKTIDELVHEIIDLDPDIVVLDFNLKYTDETVSDNGDILMQRINDRKPLLPILLLTSYKALAQKGFLSPEKRNSIYEKSMLVDLKDSSFKNEVLAYITYYRELFNRYKDEFSDLQQQKTPSEAILARLTELDSILEESVDRQSAIKAKHKTDENLDELKELIESTKDLIKEFKANPDA
jgi:DNA-binding NarL/FixJ family response regulator